jgi:hypothetical protein
MSLVDQNSNTKKHKLNANIPCKNQGHLQASHHIAGENEREAKLNFEQSPEPMGGIDHFLITCTSSSCVKEAVAGCRSDQLRYLSSTEDSINVDSFIRGRELNYDPRVQLKGSTNNLTISERTFID